MSHSTGDGVLTEGAPEARRRPLGALAIKTMALGLRASLVVSPKPTAWALRALFRRSWADRAVRQLEQAPADIVAVLDERYDTSADAYLDVYVPGEAARSGTALPVLLWTHGGAFVGGSKEELGGYLRMIAGRGFAVVAVRYQLAPEATYPSPVRQVLAALRHVLGHADRLHIDPGRVVLAGDSAGAQISAQAAALITNPAYAASAGFAPGVDPASIRAAVLCCGIFDLTQLRASGPFRHVLDGVGWAYTGLRRFRTDAALAASVDIAGNLTAAFPPTFITAGDADPLLPQSEAFAAALRAHSASVETLFHDPDHEPALGHEYQFELDRPEGAAAFERIVAFARRHTEPAGRPAPES